MSDNLVTDLNRMHNDDQAPAAPRMGTNIRQIPPAPQWARKTIGEFDLALARARKWRDSLASKMVTGEDVDFEQVLRAEAEVRKAEHQWDGVVGIAIGRRIAEHAGVIVPMAQKLAAEWWKLELQRRRAEQETRAAVEKQRTIEGKQNALYDQAAALDKPYRDVRPNDFDSAIQHLDYAGLRVGHIAMRRWPGTELAHVSGEFVWPAPPPVAAPPAPPDCVDPHGTVHQQHIIAYIAGRNQLERSFHQCQRCGKEWPPEAWPIPQSAA